MKERPILFAGELVTAILAGKKTCTRRPVRPGMVIDKLPLPMDGKAQLDGPWLKIDHGRAWQRIDSLVGRRDLDVAKASPFGVSGDRLWVRETWGDADGFYQGHTNDTPSVVAYRADERAIHWRAEPPYYVPDADRATWNWSSITWKPSIHMPRWMCRLVLDVVSVRIERLGTITEADARKEGVGAFDGLLDEVELCRMAKKLDGMATDDRTWFAVAWEYLYGKGSFSKNPWVWVVEFSRNPTATPLLSQGDARSSSGAPPQPLTGAGRRAFGDAP